MPIVASGTISVVDLNDAKQLVCYIGSSQPKTVIYNPNNGTYTPNYANNNQVLTPQLFIAGNPTDIISQAKSIRWFYQVNSGGTPVEITESDSTYTLGTGNRTLTIKQNVLSANYSMTYIVEVVYTDTSTGIDVTTKADIELTKVTNGSDGSNAVMAILTNESHVIPTDVNGNNGNYTNASTTMIIYEGTTDASASWNVTATPSSGVTGSLNGKTYTVTNMTTDTGYVDLTATKSGLPSITKRFSLSKSKQGTAGQTPTTYWLVTSVPAIAKTKTGTFVPTNVVVTGKSQTGTNQPADYAGRFKIYESTDGTTFTLKYTSSANEATYTYPSSGSLPANIKALKVELYLAGGTTTKLDEQIIPIVTDGSDGQNAVIATVWTPDGNTLKNSQGTLTAQIDVYSGGTKVTPSAFKWYIQDPTATPSNGGDSDGGNGWRLLNASYNAGITGYTTEKITIPASAIAGVESFMAIATYNGQKYRDVCTVVDVTDPIVVTIVGLNIFKNGQGSTQLTAKVYQNGQEIDVNGSEYTYRWFLYKQDGTLDTSFNKTGKTITVNATEINVRANLICEVSK